MTKAVCSVPGCPAFEVDRGRCAAHRRTTSERGYGGRHGRARRALSRLLPAPCAYGCGALLRRGDRWVAAHVVDGNQDRGWVAACSTCNERAKNGALQPVAGATIVQPDRVPRGTGAVFA